MGWRSKRTLNGSEGWHSPTGQNDGKRLMTVRCDRSTAGRAGDLHRRRLLLKIEQDCRHRGCAIESRYQLPQDETGRAHSGFDQAPDFMIPSEYNRQVVMEAKLTEDDGSARDKVTRVQHLHSLKH